MNRYWCLKCERPHYANLAKRWCVDCPEGEFVHQRNAGCRKEGCDCKVFRVDLSRRPVYDRHWMWSAKTVVEDMVAILVDCDEREELSEEETADVAKIYQMLKRKRGPVHVSA